MYVGGGTVETVLARSKMNDRSEMSEPEPIDQEAQGAKQGEHRWSLVAFQRLTRFAPAQGVPLLIS